jgi:hypothetical protein
MHSSMQVAVPSDRSHHGRRHVPLIQRPREPSIEERLVKSVSLDCVTLTYTWAGLCNPDSQSGLCNPDLHVGWQLHIGK